MAGALGSIAGLIRLAAFFLLRSNPDLGAVWREVCASPAGVSITVAK